MNLWLRMAFAFMAWVLTPGCTPPIQPPPVPEKKITPHPAKAASEAAIRLYPDLAIKDSQFNLGFRELFDHQQSSNSRVLGDVDWPLQLAHRTARMLNVKPYGAPTPEPTVVPRTLERGAYDQRSIRSRIYRYDAYGNRIP